MTEENKQEQKKREKAVELANEAARDMYKPKNIVDKKQKSHTIMVQGGEKEKTIEERIYKNGVVKRSIKSLKKNGKVLFSK